MLLPSLQYIDPIVQATFNQDGGLQEIVRALTTRLRDDNTTVVRPALQPHIRGLSAHQLFAQVFKSLIVLHTLLRAGSLDATFSYLASSSISLSLSSHEAPNIAAYAAYLAARIKSYGNLKRDVIRDKSDRRAAGRLRALGVEGGLLREVREVQRMISTLVESKVSVPGGSNEWLEADPAAVLSRRYRRRCLHDGAATARQGPPRAVHCSERGCHQRARCAAFLSAFEPALMTGHRALL